MPVKQLLENLFGGLAGTDWALTSPATPSYNCIAWAMSEHRRWWWPHPDAYWPDAAPLQATQQAFIEAFAEKGFVPCDSADLQEGVEKIALFVNANGIPTHAARQLPLGKWTSKLGKEVDIEHELYALEGQKYGTVVAILKRVL